jgi:hypothetical protein
MPSRVDKLSSSDSLKLKDCKIGKRASPLSTVINHEKHTKTLQHFAICTNESTSLRAREWPSSLNPVATVNWILDYSQQDGNEFRALHHEVRLWIVLWFGMSDMRFSFTFQFFRYCLKCIRPSLENTAGQWYVTTRATIVLDAWWDGRKSFPVSEYQDRARIGTTVTVRHRWGNWESHLLFDFAAVFVSRNCD